MNKYREDRDDLIYTIPEDIPDGFFMNNEKQLNEFMKKYNLSYSYRPTIEYFLDKESDGIDYAMEYHPDVEFIEGDGENGKKGRLYLNFPPEMRIKDIQQNWSAIKLITKNYYKNHPEIETPYSNNCYRDIEIFKLKRKGKKAKEITKIINEKYPKTPISYEEVSKIIKRLKERANKIIGGKS